MAGSMLLPGGSPVPTDATSTLQRVERNTAQLVFWVKGVLFAIVVMIVLLAVLVL